MNSREPTKPYFNWYTLRCRYSFTTFLVLIFLALFATGCRSKELTRSRAVDLISSSDPFKKPAAVNLQPEYSDNLPSFGKTSEEQSAYAMRWFYNKNPELAVLNQLGLVEFRATKINYPDTGGSPATIAPSLTDKGRTASKDWQQQGNTWVIILANRKLTEVTGITGGEGESKSARIEYTWKWEPTEVGKYFDVSNSAYQQLPEKIRENFSGRSFSSVIEQQGNIILFDSSKAQKSTAQLQLYDDGWRVVQ